MLRLLVCHIDIFLKNFTITSYNLLFIASSFYLETISNLSILTMPNDDQTTVQQRFVATTFTATAINTLPYSNTISDAGFSTSNENVALQFKSTATEFVNFTDGNASGFLITAIPSPNFNKNVTSSLISIISSL